MEDREVGVLLQVQYHGSGTHLGVKGRWTLTFRPDGAFVEDFRSPVISTASGHDGGRASKCWTVSHDISEMPPRRVTCTWNACLKRP